MKAKGEKNNVGGKTAFFYLLSLSLHHPLESARTIVTYYYR
jgi:hypothetical protein